MKKVLSFIIIAIIVISNGSYAISEDLTTPPIYQISDDPEFAIDIKYFPSNNNMLNPAQTGEDGLQLTSISSSIRREGSSTVLVSVSTIANQVCVDIGGSVTVQRWINNTWTYYCGFSFWEHGVSSASTSRSISVASGYYYRVTVAHMAGTVHSTKSGHTTTKSIFVN